MTGTHDRHDLFQIAALAGGDLDGPERSAAEALVGECPECALLLADLRAISAATAALPPRPRTIDFRLTESDARRLGARGWRRALQAIADSRFGFGRPLAVGLTTLGLVGLITASIPVGLGGAGGAATGGAGTTNQSARDAAQPSAGGASTEVGGESPQQPAPGPTASRAPAAAASDAFTTNRSPAPTDTKGGVAGVAGPVASPGTSAAPSAEPGTGALEDTGSPDRLNSTGATAPATGPSPVVVLSTLALLVGLVVIVAQWAAARFVRG